MSAPDRPTREAVAAAVDVVAAEIMRIHAPLSTDEDSAESDASDIVAALQGRPAVLAALVARTPQPAERAPLDVSGPLIVGAAGVPIDAYDAINLLASRDDDFPARLLASRARTVADFWNDPPNAWQKVAATSEFPELADALDQLLDGGPGDLTDVRPAVPAPLPAVPDGEDVPARLDAAAERHEDRWAVFCGDPSDAEDIVNVFDDRFEAEELAQRVIDARIGHRRITITEPAWMILACCGACGAVLDGEACCDGRLAEIEAGEAVLAENAAVAAALATRPTERGRG